MNTEQEIKAGVRGLIVSVDGDITPEELICFGAGLEEKFGIPVCVVNRPVTVHSVPDLQYGVKNSAGQWMRKPDATIISGTKAEMCATRDAAAEYGDTYTVAPLPTE